jgi:signal transduction histidine kinase
MLGSRHGTAMNQTRWIGGAGLVAWVLVGLPAILYHAGSAPPGGGGLTTRQIWRTAGFLLFGVLFAFNLSRPRLPIFVAESLVAVALAFPACNGYEGTPMVLVALQLGFCYGPRLALPWIGGQTALLAIATALDLSPRASYLLVPPYLGFQLVAFVAAHRVAQEIPARATLAQANAELRALQEVLADSSRLAERLRITHELHDALGHRLTALSLNLEAALQRSTGAVKPNIEVAQSLARELLADVRQIVADSRGGDGVHLAFALQNLVRAVPRPQIHLRCPRVFE